ncbi:MAG: hypothetical protein Q7S50_00725 [bacterium]|nr:hypothetical protein [bacterium]
MKGQSAKSLTPELESEPARLTDKEWAEIFEAFQYDEKDRQEDQRRRFPSEISRGILAGVTSKLRRVHECRNIPTTALELDLRSTPGYMEINRRFQKKGLPFRLGNFSELSKSALLRKVAIARVKVDVLGHLTAQMKRATNAFIGVLSQGC